MDILNHDFSHAVPLLLKTLKQHPENTSLRVALGRAYLYQGKYRAAIRQFREVLRRDPKNRLARLELARALGDRGDYTASSDIYRALLADNPRDEAAAIGLSNNLMHENKASEAMQVARQGLHQHPESLVLQEYEDRIRQEVFGGDENVIRKRNMSLTSGVNYIGDSIGNRLWRFSHLYSYPITPHLRNDLSLDERHMTASEAADIEPASVASGMDTLRYGVGRWAIVNLGGGAVRFGDGTSRSIYNAGLALRPVKSLWLSGNFSRAPFYPDATAAGYDLTTEGWRARADWRPGPWRVNAWWWKQHYTDGNLSRRGSVETYRWFGRPGLSVQAGYQYTRIDFHQNLDHGYFSPDEYQSHLGMTGLRFRVKRIFHARYTARLGTESIAQDAPFQTAWELSLGNWLTLKRWEVGGEYFRLHLVQNSGAFVTHGGVLYAKFRF